ncbi:MAG: LamG domain-containing protein, partial [Planctomycetota bacterium]
RPPGGVHAVARSQDRPDARDPDDNPLRYRLLESPEGAALNPTSGTLNWTGTTDGAIDLRGGRTFGRITAPHAPSLVLTDATLETWFQFNDFRQSFDQYLITKGRVAGATSDVTYGLAYHGGKLRAIIGDGTVSGTRRFDAPFSPQLDRWYHLAMTFDDDAGEVRLYIDGELVATHMTDQHIGNDGQTLQIGSPNDNVHRANGKFDNTRIWNVVRTPEQIREGMNRQYDGDPSLVLDYRYESWEAQTVRDHSVYHNDGVRDGSARVQPTGGLALDGSGHFRVAVEDGRGGFDEQSFDVTLVPPLRGSVSGTVFVDANADGTFQAGEQVLPDWLLYA